jgi:hypothetical protein
LASWVSNRETVGCTGDQRNGAVFSENRTVDGDLPHLDELIMNKAKPVTAPAVIDPSLLKFALALFIVGVMVELVDQASHTAAWTLVGILILGLLLNNPLAISLISLGGKTLEQGVR